MFCLCRDIDDTKFYLIIKENQNKFKREYVTLLLDLLIQVGLYVPPWLFVILYMIHPRFHFLVKMFPCKKERSRVYLGFFIAFAVQYASGICIKQQQSVQNLQIHEL